MNFVYCYGRNVYIDDELVGYITKDQDGAGVIYISGHLFCRVSDDGVFTINGEKVGYIDDDEDIYLHDKWVGEVTPQYDLKFDGDELNGD